jgi:hypothetical protein
MPTRQVGAYGSLLDAIGDVLDVVGGAASGLVEGVVDLVSHAVGGGGPGVTAAVGTARRAVEAITRTESRQEYRQHSKEEERETIQSIRRTFSNPYRDRTMQLRFIPVYRRFEVRTAVTRIQPGIAAQYGSISAARESRPSSKLVAGPLNAASSGPGQLNQAQAAVTTRANVASLQKPLGAMLQRAAGKTAAGANPSGTLLWSESYIREDSLHVPLADTKAVAGAMKLSGATKTMFEKAIGLTGPSGIAKLPKAPTQTVHLFMGTHIEAVAGGCVLQDLPPLTMVP